ncbi:uncharacterized protein LOC131180089 [Hevea brasiliensis]|uniref:uncharacterized protein LOC131180089 n=1 Tax=Hevea brasiliensis TaxID=3981 RepID=UPI0025E6EA2F|nr:uncharacterized protein LOC131180089 [Hevea brasiliensis]
MTRTRPEEEIVDLDPERDRTLRIIKRERKHEGNDQRDPEIPNMADNNNNRPRLLKDYGAPSIQGFQPSVTRPTAEEKKEEAKQKQEEEARKKKKPPEPYQPPLPFPQRFLEARLDKQFGKFLEVLQKLYINIPFIEALSQMPSYAKFLKDILSKKRRLEDYKTVALTEECNAILQNKLPLKLKDPGSFSILYLIGNMNIDKALCDLGVSVSVMPLSICNKLDVGELKPTTISLQLVDRFVKYPVGILENIPIKVGKFFIPVDFVVWEMEEDV